MNNPTYEFFPPKNINGHNGLQIPSQVSRHSAPKSLKAQFGSCGVHDRHAQWESLSNHVFPPGWDTVHRSQYSGNDIQLEDEHGEKTSWNT